MRPECDAMQVACGDPTCAPIDTVLQFTWQQGLSKPLGIPKVAAEVTQEDIEVRAPPPCFYQLTPRVVMRLGRSHRFFLSFSGDPG